MSGLAVCEPTLTGIIYYPARTRQPEGKKQEGLH
jgi:hypothetical protein